MTSSTGFSICWLKECRPKPTNRNSGLEFHVSCKKNSKTSLLATYRTINVMRTLHLYYLRHVVNIHMQKTKGVPTADISFSCGQRTKTYEHVIWFGIPRLTRGIPNQSVGRSFAMQKGDCSISTKVTALSSYKIAVDTLGALAKGKTEIALSKLASRSDGAIPHIIL